jgi:hypothetical protein
VILVLGVRTRLMIRPPVQHVCTLVRLNFVYENE